MGAKKTKKEKELKNKIDDSFDNTDVEETNEELERVQESIDEKPGTKQGEAEAVKLTTRQELFCQLYASDKEFFGNGVMSYAEAYNIDLTRKGAYKAAQAAASRLLSNVIICDRINNILSDEGLNEAFVDKQLLLVIKQHANLPAKVAAIKEFNALKQRVTQKIDHTTKGEKINVPLTDEKLTEALKDFINYRKKNV